MPYRMRRPCHRQIPHSYQNEEQDSTTLTNSGIRSVPVTPDASLGQPTPYDVDASASPTARCTIPSASSVNRRIPVLLISAGPRSVYRAPSGRRHPSPDRRQFRNSLVHWVAANVPRFTTPREPGEVGRSGVRLLPRATLFQASGGQRPQAAQRKPSVLADGRNTCRRGPRAEGSNGYGRTAPMVV